MNTGIFSLSGAAGDCFLLALRLTGFTAMTFILFRPILPPSAVLAVWAGFIGFTAPLVLGGLADDPAGLLFSLDSSAMWSMATAPRITAPKIFAELCIGVMLGLTASAVFFAARLAGCWAAASVFRALLPDTLWEEERCTANGWTVLFCLLAFLSFSPFLSRLFEMLLASLIEVPLGQVFDPRFFQSGMFIALVKSVGAVSFSLSLIVLLPVFAAVLLSSLAALVIHRACPSLRTPQLLAGGLIPILTLVLAAGLFRASVLFGEIADRTFVSTPTEAVQRLSGGSAGGR